MLTPDWFNDNVIVVLKINKKNKRFKILHIGQPNPEDSYEFEEKLKKINHTDIKEKSDYIG